MRLVHLLGGSLVLLCMLGDDNGTNAQAGDKILIIHGGAGTISPEHGEAKKVVMLDSIRAGYEALLNADDAQGAVEAAIRVMEDSPAFNAGTGAVRTITGEIEMDAIIINGTDLSTGAVGAVRHIKNPISLAKMVKDDTDHVFLVGYEAELFALNNNVTLVPTSSLIARWNETFQEDRLHDFLYPKNKMSIRSSDFDVGTVGAVAMNSKGQIFAGTSTGGMSNKMNGRIGDAPLVGCGTLADDLIGGISATGWGEAFIRYRVASRVADLMERGTMNATTAIYTVLEGMAARIEAADGGVIAITKNGEIGFGWNSEQMAWAYSSGVDIHYGVNKGEDFVVPLNITSTSTTPTGPSSTTPIPNTSTSTTPIPTTPTSTTASPNAACKNSAFHPLLIFMHLGIGIVALRAMLSLDEP